MRDLLALEFREGRGWSGEPASNRIGSVPYGLVGSRAHDCILRTPRGDVPVTDRAPPR
jgi:hypothetical protein